MNPFDALPDIGFTRTRRVAHLCDVTPQTIYNWVKRGHLPAPTRIGPNASGFPNPVLKAFGSKLGPRSE